MSKKSEAKLLEQFKDLPIDAQKSLLDFCDFLSAQNPILDKDTLPPKNISRPENESVVLAMRRLSDTYFMLNKDSLLHEASSLMSQHILQGREAIEVIDDLEALFKKFYTELIDKNNSVDIMDDEND